MTVDNMKGTPILLTRDEPTGVDAGNSEAAEASFSNVTAISFSGFSCHDPTRLLLENFYSCIWSTKDHNGECSTDVQVEIEASKVHLSESVTAGKQIADANLEYIRSLQQECPDFFQVWSDMKKFRSCEPTPVVKLYGGNLLGFKCSREVIESRNLDLRKVKEVRQKYEVEYQYFSEGKLQRSPPGSIMKVFKGDILVHDLRRQWSQSSLHNHLKESRVGFIRGKNKDIQGAMLLIDGKFAFVMFKYWGDLRKPIDGRIQLN